MADQVDVAILGGGNGGYACALRAAQLGLSVTLVEQDKVGGTCLHRGCIPTKALLHAAELVEEIRSAASVGVGGRAGCRRRARDAGGRWPVAHPRGGAVPDRGGPGPRLGGPGLRGGRR